MSENNFKLGDYRDQMITCGLEISRRLNLDDEQREWIKYAIILHDIGKSTIPSHILNKKDRLTEKEMSVVKSHPIRGAETVRNFRFNELIKGMKFVESVAPMTRHTYERWDGSGYPDGLSGESIPIGSRVLAVVSTYAAMLADRPYRVALTPEEAVLKIKAGAGSLYDPKVVEHFLEYYEGQKSAKV